MKESYQRNCEPVKTNHAKCTFPNCKRHFFCIYPVVCDARVIFSIVFNVYPVTHPSICYAQKSS